MTILQLKVSNPRRCIDRRAGTTQLKHPMSIRPGLIRIAVILLTVTGCAKVPDGAKFEVTGLVPLLTDQKLTLPWIPLSSTGQYKWCFANLGFSGSRAQVLLEIVNSQPFDPRNAGGIVGLSIADSKGTVVYSSVGPLRDSENVTGQSNRWFPSTSAIRAGQPPT